MAIKKVLVVGSGLMGGGIAQVCAQSGIEVVLHDVSAQALGKALKSIEWSVGKFVEKGQLKESKDVVMSRIRTSEHLAGNQEVDLAVEAVFEDLLLKQKVFKELDKLCGEGTLMASNTSAIPITELAAVTRRPERVFGLHFFNPVPMMEVVEVIKGMKSSEETMRAGFDFVRVLGKEPIRVEKDIPGFLLNRINLVSYVEAVRLLEQGIGNVEDIDKGVRLAFGRRMGPFETGDLVGLDVSYGAMTAIYEESKDAAILPPATLKAYGQGW